VLDARRLARGAHARGEQRRGGVGVEVRAQELLGGRAIAAVDGFADALLECGVAGERRRERQRAVPFAEGVAAVVEAVGVDVAEAQVRPGVTLVDGDAIAQLILRRVELAVGEQPIDLLAPDARIRRRWRGWRRRL